LEKLPETSEKWTNYTAFGATMPGRNFTSSSYRYGFNGKENDNEIKGNGNSYDYGERMYDPRIGRWLKPDKYEVVLAGWSTYAFGMNCPIKYSDVEGNFVIDEATAKAYPNLKPALNNLLKELQKPENESKLALIMKAAEFKSKEDLFKVLTDGQGPKLEVLDIQNVTQSVFDMGPNQAPFVRTDLDRTELGIKLGVGSQETAVTETKYQITQTGKKLAGQRVIIDDMIAESLGDLTDKEGKPNPEIQKMFNAVIIHEVGHVGDDRDFKPNSSTNGEEVGYETEKFLNGEVINTDKHMEYEPK